MTRALFPVVALSALIALAGAAPLRAQQQSPRVPPEPEQDQGLSMSKKDISKNPMIQAASKVPPTPPHVIQALIPEATAGLERASLDGNVRWLGPAGMTEVTAEFGKPEGKSMTISVTDFAGLPRDGINVLPALAEEEKRPVGKQTLEGFALEGFPGTRRHAPGHPGGIVQVRVGERFLVAAESRTIPVDALTEALAALDLARLPPLAPPRRNE
jgi:hypothetical protein